MDRRELLKMIALVTGGTVIGGELFLSGCKVADKPLVNFTEDIIALLDEVGETIIPGTETPGAKAAEVGKCMKVMVTDCYTENEAVLVRRVGERGDIGFEQVERLGDRRPRRYR